MKNLYFLPVLLLLSTPMFAQVEFAPAGAEWYHLSTSGYTSEQFAYSGFSYAQYTGDTVFDGLTCKIICTRLYRFESTQPPSCNADAMLHFIYQRADSIFEYAPGPVPRSRFLFRNNYAVGEVVHKSGAFELTVRTVDTLEFNGRPVRRFHIGDGGTWDVATYDLFGPENGLFSYDPWNFIADDATVKLRCYQDAAFPRVNVGNQDCDAVLKPANTFFKVHFLPNPVRDELVMYVEALPAPEHTRFTIYDAAGHFILEDRLDYTWKKIPVGHLSAGVYLCVFRDGNSIFHQKFVKN